MRRFAVSPAAVPADVVRMRRAVHSFDRAGPPGPLLHRSVLSRRTVVVRRAGSDDGIAIVGRVSEKPTSGTVEAVMTAVTVADVIVASPPSLVTTARTVYAMGSALAPSGQRMAGVAKRAPPIRRPSPPELPRAIAAPPTAAPTTA